MLPDFDPIEMEVSVAPAAMLHPPLLKLERSKGSAQLSSIPSGAEFELRQNSKPIRHGKTPEMLGNLPTGFYEVVAKQGTWELKESIEIKRGEVALKTFRFANGSVKIISAPTGATVSSGGKDLGTTPMLLDEVKPGDVSYQLELAGFKPSQVHGKTSQPGARRSLAKFDRDAFCPGRQLAHERVGDAGARLGGVLRSYQSPSAPA